MKYWNEMRDKYGFSDGNTVPVEAETCRTVYVRVLNVLLEKEKSNTRVQAFDRPGVHNYCLIICVEAKAKNKDKEVNDQFMDNAFNIAIEIANDLALDDYVEVEVCIKEDALEELLGNNPALSGN